MHKKKITIVRPVKTINLNVKPKPITLDAFGNTNLNKFRIIFIILKDNK